MCGLEKGSSSLWFWTCVLCPLRILCFCVCPSVSSMLNLPSSLFAFEPSRSHEAVILFLSHFLPLFWYCLTQYSHHLSLSNLYWTLRSESLHMKVINNLLPNPKALFNLWNLVFEILTKLLIMFSLLKNLLFHYVCDTAFS